MLTGPWELQNSPLSAVASFNTSRMNAMESNLSTILKLIHYILIKYFQLCIYYTNPPDPKYNFLEDSSGTACRLLLAGLQAFGSPAGQVPACRRCP